MDKKSNVEDIVKESKKPARKKKLKGNIPIGSDLADLVIGGGMPYGIVNIVGDSSSGKSFLSGELLAMAYHSFNKEIEWFYDDVEKGYRFNTKKLYDMDILNGGFLKQKKRSHTIEDFETNLQEIIDGKDPNKPFIYVLDSFDALTTDDEVAHRKKKLSDRKKKKEDDTEKKEKGSYNLSKQKENHAIFRTRVREIEENKIILVVVSQVKEKIGISFGAKLYRTGGKSLDFYPNVVLWLAEVEKYIKKDRPVGVCVKVKGTKVRNDKPFRTCYVDLLFDYGIDNLSSNLKFLYDLKTGLGKDTKSSKKKLKWDEEELTLQELIQFIEDNNLEDELKKRTLQKWNDIEQEISSDNRKKKWGK
ncbi:MAG: hypothetical protein GY870_14590 [archaeon]|nr:hypothetical protein [archaeon]